LQLSSLACLALLHLQLLGCCCRMLVLLLLLALLLLLQSRL
jgi:hypothetical protein